MMAITKEHVFMVSGRYRDDAGDPRGEVLCLVVCSLDTASVRLLMEQTEPNFAILSVLSLVHLEETVKKVRSVVSGKDTSWPVVVDPILMAG
jgi:hypothetical protein